MGKIIIILIALFIFAGEVQAKTEIACGDIPQDRLMVALTFGQSNAANRGETRYDSIRSVYSLNNGKCYKAEDPLLGASGFRGSVWTRLGDRLIDEGLYDAVLFIPIAVGGTKIAHWIPNGLPLEGASGGYYCPDGCYYRGQQAINDINALGFTFTHLLWHQGESDAYEGTTKEEYKDSFNIMLSAIRSEGVVAPIFVSVATYVYGTVYPEIQEAQRELVNADLDIYAGADTDTLTGSLMRYDYAHLSTRGLADAAELWLEAIRDKDGSVEPDPSPCGG